MKTKIFLSAVTASLLALTMNAQDSNTGTSGDDAGGGRFFISVSVGAGLPMGNFGKSDSVGMTGKNDTTKLKGFANTGYNFNLKGGYRFCDHVGVMMQFGGNVNSFNVSEYQTLYLPANEKGIYLFSSAGPHYIGSYLIGPFITYPLGSKFDFDAHIMAGLMTAYYSPINEYYTPPASLSAGTYSPWSETIKQVLGPATAFCYNIGAGLKYKLNTNLGLTLSADYLGGTPNFIGYSKITTVTDPGVGPAVSTQLNTSYKMAMSTGLVNVNIGLAYWFN